MKKERRIRALSCARVGGKPRVVPYGWIAGLLATFALGCSEPGDRPGAAAGAAPAGRSVRMSVPTRIDPASIDGNVRVTLVGNTHPRANPAHDLGPIEDDFLLEHMQLVLKRDAGGEATLEAHIDALHDPTSPQYHQWLTAQEFGDQYGVSKADIATIASWLESHGLRVDSVPTSRMFIEFSATAGQVREAFHTEVHRLNVNGVPHIANMSDPQIPAALADVVVGVHALHDFMPHPLHHDRGRVAHRVRIVDHVHPGVHDRRRHDGPFYAVAPRRLRHHLQPEPALHRRESTAPARPSS